jgi:hypothetical protein
MNYELENMSLTQLKDEHVMALVCLEMLAGQCRHNPTQRDVERKMGQAKYCLNLSIEISKRETKEDAPSQS